jgi:adenylate cyclase
MGMEIERKFLVVNDSWLPLVQAATLFQQKCLLRDASGSTARVRLRDGKAIVTLKGPPSKDNLSRSEFEWEVPLDQGTEMLQAFPGPGITKTRHKVPYTGVLFEVDRFHGHNSGLVVAEVEFPSREAAEAFTNLPSWLGAEVTTDKRYSNALLEINPWPNWGR